MSIDTLKQINTIIDKNMAITSVLIKFLGSQLFSNLLLLLTLVVAFFVGYRQILLNDTVEIYASPSVKEVINLANNVKSQIPIISLQNTGTRLVYLDKYIFNGVDYKTHGQVLPPTYAQTNGLYYIDLPTNGVNHVSLKVYYHDLDSRSWETNIVADLENGSWKVSSFPRSEQ